MIMLGKKLMDNMTDHFQIVIESTHVSGPLIGYVYIKKILMQGLFTNIFVRNIYFSDHNAVTIVI